MSHRDEHEELLGLALAGGESERREAERLVASCPECAELWAGLLRLEGALDTAGREQRTVLEEARSMGAVPGDEELERVVSHKRAQARSLRLRQQLVGLALAAGVLLAVGFFAFGPGAPVAPDPGPQYLGPEESGGLAPAGAVAEYGAFRWELERPMDGWFVVNVYAEVDGTRGELLASWETEENTWTPSSSAWPAGIVWEVSAFDASGSVVASAVARASR